MKTEKYYDEFSKKYDCERQQGYFDFVNKMEIETLAPFIKGKKVLEVGCGTGIILNEVSKLAREAVGIDVSPKMLGVAKKKGLNVKEASAENLPFPDKSFDVVYSFKVLAHVQGIEKALAEIERVAKPGAVLVLEFYNPFSIKYLVNFFQPKNVFIRYDSVERVKAMLPKNLRIVGKRGIRIISPAFFLFHFPVLGKILKAVEKALSYPLAGLGSYLILIIKKG